MKIALTTFNCLPLLLGEPSREVMEKKRVGIFTPPIAKAGITPLSNLIKILSSESKELCIISGNNGKFVINDFKVSNYKIFIHTTGKSQLSRILAFVSLQIKMSIDIFRFSKHCDFWLFFLGGEIYIIPLIIARLQGKRVCCVLCSSASELLSHDPHHRVINFLSKIGYFLSNKIIVYSPRIISDWHLESYREKILIAHEHYLDFNTITVTSPLSIRPPLIGFIGRLSEEKGVLHFIQALPAILGNQQDVRVLIGGDGQLKEAVEISLREEGLNDRVDLLGWISHDDLPTYLNQLRLLVLPSYTEGLPNIMLEAMACGTPVLATPVGAIPDVIIDGETGFIMENNSPQCIAENVIRTLSSPELEKIAGNARQFVEECFTFEKTVENWGRILKGIE